MASKRPSGTSAHSAHASTPTVPSAGEAGGEGLSASRVEHRLSHCAYGERCGDVEVVISEHATPRVANEMATFGKFEGKWFADIRSTNPGLARWCEQRVQGEAGPGFPGSMAAYVRFCNEVDTLEAKPPPREWTCPRHGCKLTGPRAPKKAIYQDREYYEFNTGSSCYFDGGFRFADNGAHIPHQRHP